MARPQKAEGESGERSPRRNDEAQRPKNERPRDAVFPERRRFSELPIVEWDEV